MFPLICHRKSERRQCDESKQRRWDSLLGDLGSIFVAVECCRVGDVFFPSVEYLDPNFGVTHVGIGYCITSSDILIRIQILLTEGACWN